MSDDNRKPPAPKVQVIRRAGAPTTPGVVRPTVVPRAPVAPRVPAAVSPTPGPAPSAPVPVPVAPLAPTHAVLTGATVTIAPRIAPAGKAPFRGPPRSSAPRSPPTAEGIAALARKERVPNRIAKGDLEGKMKCRIWKKLHAEEAKRFDQAWTLVEANPGLDLADAFGVVQSGLSIPDFQARRARAKKREDIKVARATVVGAVIDEFVNSLIADSSELALVLGERTVLDVLKAVAPVSFTVERGGRLEKLNVVLMTRKSTWDKLLTTLERDPKLAHKPVPVARQPARRPVNDPRPFLDHVGSEITLQLRNGISITQPLLAVGPFDVLLGTQQETIFVPLHAMLSWSAAASAAEA